MIEEEAAKKAALEKSKKEKEESENAAETAVTNLRKGHDDKMKKMRKEHDNAMEEAKVNGNSKQDELKPLVKAQDSIDEAKPTSNSRSLVRSPSEEKRIYRAKSEEDNKMKNSIREAVDSGCGCLIS